MDFEYTNDGAVPEALERIARLPPEAIVLYVSANITGKVHSPGKIAEMLAHSSSAPVFCLATSQLDTGVVGGSMADMEGLSAMLDRPDIRCLFMSGYAANVIAHHGGLDEGVRFIQKPFSIHDLALRVRDTLKASAMTRWPFCCQPCAGALHEGPSWAPLSHSCCGR